MMPDDEEARIAIPVGGRKPGTISGYTTRPARVEYCSIYCRSIRNGDLELWQIKEEITALWWLRKGALEVASFDGFER
jgi:hypothetical protein